jgi:hypothetical protein
MRFVFQALFLVVVLVVLGTEVVETRVHAADGQVRAPVQVEINRPKTAFDCDTPRGESWYGSTERCLDELCAGQNVYNEYIFEGPRRRKNPCYGRSPTEFQNR